MSAGASLALRALGHGDEDALAAFFEALVAAGDTERFHPHPFDAGEAARICGYGGKDVYAAAVVDRGDAGREVVAYGLLRGWDEGYAIPSLGIAVSPLARGAGYGRLMMGWLHAQARLRQAPSVMLKVYPDNARAKGLYESLGYVFEEALVQGQLKGFWEVPGGG